MRFYFPFRWATRMATSLVGNKNHFHPLGTYRDCRPVCQTVKRPKNLLVQCSHGPPTKRTVTIHISIWTGIQQSRVQRQSMDSADSQYAAWRYWCSIDGLFLMKERGGTKGCQCDTALNRYGEKICSKPLSSRPKSWQNTPPSILLRRTASGPTLNFVNSHHHHKTDRNLSPCCGSSGISGWGWFLKQKSLISPPCNPAMCVCPSMLISRRYWRVR